MMGKGMVFRLTVITFIVLLSNMSLGTDATVYQVGGVSEAINWRCCDIDYQAWADTITFVAGDVLVFRFETGVSDMAFVSKEDYNSCHTSSLATARIFTNSPTRWTLTAEPQTKYFMTTGTNCDKQNFILHMLSNSPDSPPPSPSPVPPTQSPPSDVPTPPSSGPISDTNPSPDTTSTPTPNSKSNPPKDAPNSKNDHKSKSSSKKKKIVIGCVVGGVGITITIGISIKLYFVFGKKSRKKKEKSGAAAAGKKRRAKNTNKDAEATDVEQK